MRKLLLLALMTAVLALAASPALAYEYTDYTDPLYWAERAASDQAMGCAYGVDAYCNPAPITYEGWDYADAYNAALADQEATLDAFIAAYGCDPYAFMATPECYAAWLEFST